MKNIRLFETKLEYDAVQDSFEYPTVSYIKEVTEVHYVKPISNEILDWIGLSDWDGESEISETSLSSPNKYEYLMRYYDNEHATITIPITFNGVDISHKEWSLTNKGLSCCMRNSSNTLYCIDITPNNTFKGYVFYDGAGA